ncbi:MAG TPA: methyltransferase domain-containing protein [Mariprofundaceae bacterium]|nr:methyltransferase domain-containing protein [Mariprofundaceae bacterium]
MTSGPQTSKAWETRYRNGQTGWDRGGTSASLGYWLQDDELSPCRVLIPGCGRGHEVIELAQHGFDTTALDVAPSAVDHVRTSLAEKQLDGCVEQADVLHWQPSAPFEAIYEQTCLCALPPSKWEAYERQLHRWLKSGGRLFALFMQTGMEDGPPFHCDLLRMRQLFDSSRWQWPEETPILTPHRDHLFELGYILTRR